MATTTKTVKTYALNGSLKDFTIPFEYLARKFVAVTLIGATRKELVLNLDFRFSTPTTITTLRAGAWGPADNFDLIEIRRFTSATERLVDYADGSILRAYDLNTSQVQSLHIAEEARDLTADTIGVNNEGHLDARARRIVNVADAVNPGDAVNLRMQTQWAGSALNSATASANSATASANSATASQASRVASETARDASVVAKNASEAARDVANTHKNAAATSATNSEASNQTAYKWANNPENTVVNSGQYSAFHWVQKAFAYATNALGYSNNAATSASQAAQKVTDAAAQVTLATAQADRAKTEADKLGNMNSLGAALESVTGVNVSWKGSITAALPMYSAGGFVAKAGADNESNFSMANAAGADPIRLVRTLDRTIHLFDNNGTGDRMTWTASGVQVPRALTVSGYTTLGASEAGSMTVKGGFQVQGGNCQVFSTSGAANSHLWFYDNAGNSRGIIYAGQDRSIKIAPGDSTHTFESNGTVRLVGSLVVAGVVYAGNGNAAMGTDGNLTGGIWGGTGLSQSIYNTADNRGWAWAGDPTRIGQAISNFRVNSLGVYMMALAHNNSGIDWNEGVAGGNLTACAAAGAYFAGYNLAGNWVRLGRITNADGASADSVTTYMRYA
ncbi:non-contractile tail fiber protein [Pseudomonas phage 10P302A]|uniref:Non-contractile tail fiber protein n=1 Tax=Pseudomonas phage 10P302A TaxID=3038233 RepID=A0AAF0GKN6_9CAUD|nr:non-contractile tail fiber protein [Pseudomonas phage 10P302A]